MFSPPIDPPGMSRSLHINVTETNMLRLSYAALGMPSSVYKFLIKQCHTETSLDDAPPDKYHTCINSHHAVYSENNLPLLFRLEAPRFEDLPPLSNLIENDQVVKAHDGRPIRAFPFLPRYISIRPAAWLLEYWMRTDPATSRRGWSSLQPSARARTPSTCTENANAGIHWRCPAGRVTATPWGKSRLSVLRAGRWTRLGITRLWTSSTGGTRALATSGLRCDCAPGLWLAARRRTTLWIRFWMVGTSMCPVSGSARR